MSAEDVVFLNPRTCGIYKNGAPRYKTPLAVGGPSRLTTN